MKDNSTLIMLINKGVSINKISLITGICKSRIYYHYKKIKGRKIRLIEFNFKNKQDLGEFLGIFCGDGSFYFGKNSHYTIRIYTGFYEVDYRVYLENTLTEWFGKKPRMIYTKFKGKASLVTFSYDSKEIYLLLKEYLLWSGKKTYSVHLKRKYLQDLDLRIGFLRGLMDTDGNYYAPKHRSRFSTVSPLLAFQIGLILKKQGITFRLYKTKPRFKTNKLLYDIAIHGSESKKLINLINPKNPNKKMQ